MTQEQKDLYDYQIELQKIELQRCQARKRFCVMLAAIGVFVLLSVGAIVAIMTGSEEAGTDIVKILSYALLGGGSYGAGYLVKLNGGHPKVQVRPIQKNPDVIG